MFSPCIYFDTLRIFVIYNCEQQHGHFLLTRPIWATAHERGQHLDGGGAVGVLLQAPLNLNLHPLLHLQQLGLAETELSQRLSDLP